MNFLFLNQKFQSKKNGVKITYEGTKPIEDFEKIHDENNAAREGRSNPMLYSSINYQIEF